MNIEKIGICIALTISAWGLNATQEQDVLMSDYVNLHTELIDIAEEFAKELPEQLVLRSESEEAPIDTEEEIIQEEVETGLKSSYASPNGLQVLVDGSEFDFKNMGCIDMYGLHYTYYSSNVLYHYQTSEWYACDDGIYRTEDGYIVVASNDYEKGTIVDTPFGKGIVLDCGCSSGTIDIYVNF